MFFLGSNSLLILEQHSNHLDLMDKFKVYVEIRLTTRVKCFYTSVIHHHFPLICVGLGLHFHTVMLFQGQQNKLIQEHV